MGILGTGGLLRLEQDINRTRTYKMILILTLANAKWYGSTGKIDLTLRGIVTLFAVLPALCLAQAPEVLTQQRMLEELKAIQGALERLENSQRRRAGMLRIQIDEQLVAALQAQRLQLSAREAELNKEMAVTVGRLQHTRSGESPPELQEVTVTSGRVTTGDLSP